MIGFALSHWPVWAALLLGWAGGRLWMRPLRRAATPSARPVWAPEVSRATERGYDYRNTYGEPVDHAVAVRIRKGKQTLTVGTAPVAADDFEERLRLLTQAAEERAAAMNAAELEVAA